MLFYVEMIVCLLVDMDLVKVVMLKVEEKVMCQWLMNEGMWCYLWWIVGQYVNVSIFDVESVQQLYDVLSQLLLFLYMEMEVWVLCWYLFFVWDDDW